MILPFLLIDERIFFHQSAMLSVGVVVLNPFSSDELVRKIEQIASRIELMHLDAYLRYVRNWRKRLLMDFFSGAVRGIGFSVGFSILGALLIYLLRNMAMVNLPVIGRFLAELVRIVENNL